MGAPAWGRLSLGCAARRGEGEGREVGEEVSDDGQGGKEGEDGEDS